MHGVQVPTGSTGSNGSTPLLWSLSRDTIHQMRLRCTRIGAHTGAWMWSWTGRVETGILEGECSFLYFSGTKVTVGTRSESQYLVLAEVDGVRWLLSPPAPPCCPLCSVLIPSLLQVLFNNTFCHNFNCYYIEYHRFNGKSIGRTCKNIFVQNRCIFECTTNIFGALKQDLISLILMGKLGISHQNSDKGLQL